MQSSGEEEVVLRSGAYRARVAPAAGGRVGSLAWCGEGRPVDLLVPWDGSAFQEHTWPKAGAFPMLPFANRLPPEGFRFAGRAVRPDGAPDGVIQHGVAHRRPWEIIEASQERVCMRLEERALPGWPWSWSAEMETRLAPEGMQVTMRVRNESRDPMPLGMGWHPYHPAGSAIAASELSFEARARHDLDGAARASTFATEPRFGMRQGETAAFSRWSGRAGLQVPRGRILVACKGARQVVLHRPALGDYVCIEPVTVLPGHMGDGSDILDPGESRQLSWTCGFEPGG